MKVLHVSVEQDDGWFIAQGLEETGVITQGRTLDEIVANVREVIELIRRMATENTGLGAPRIRAELRLLGHDVAESTVAKYLPSGRVRREGDPQEKGRGCCGCRRGLVDRRAHRDGDHGGRGRVSDREALA